MLTDANDLHVSVGLDAVKAMVAAAFEPTQEPPSQDIPPEDSPPPSEEVARFSIAELVQRFQLAMPDGKVWDARESRLLKKGAAKDWWGAKLFQEWLDHPARATVDQEDVRQFAAAAQLRGRGGLSEALQRYVYIYPTDSVWDRATRSRIPVSALKLAIADVFDGWLKHPSRADIAQESLVFDPSGPLEQEGRINTFRGLPLEPIFDDEKCSAICGLIAHLVNLDQEVYRWLLKWLALPLQQVGAKMRTAVLFHSEQQGSGKSLLFEEIVKPIYGDYGATLGQHQLESSYTDWRSEALYALFEEIFSRESKFSYTGIMKQMITGKTQRIEKKFVSGWEESNYLNAVFLSNEIQPFPLDPSDRRMLVVWPLKKLPDELRLAVQAEIAAGGVQAFYGMLLQLDLEDFTVFTEPVITEAKERLIDYSRFSWDLFHRDWAAGRLEWPYCTCLVADLYRAYRRWCQRTGERDLTLQKFSNNISTRERRRRDVDYETGGYSGPAKGTILQIGSPPDGMTQKQWLGADIKRFQDSWKGESE